MHKNANANIQCHYIMGLNIMQDKYRGYVDKWASGAKRRRPIYSQLLFE